jgi:hypothetical protein
VEGNCFLKLIGQPFEARMSSTKFLTSAKTKFNLKRRQLFIPYLTVTIPFNYRDQPVNTVWEHNPPVWRRQHETDEKKLCRQNVEFLHVK